MTLALLLACARRTPVERPVDSDTSGDPVTKPPTSATTETTTTTTTTGTTEPVDPDGPVLPRVILTGQPEDRVGSYVWAVGDLTADGVRDYVVSIQDGDSAAILVSGALAPGTYPLRDVATATLDFYADEGRYAAAGDTDGDGFADLWDFDAALLGTKLFRGPISGVLDHAAPDAFLPNPLPFHIGEWDFDQDGVLDVLAAGSSVDMRIYYGPFDGEMGTDDNPLPKSSIGYVYDCGFGNFAQLFGDVLGDGSLLAGTGQGFMGAGCDPGLTLYDVAVPPGTVVEWWDIETSFMYSDRAGLVHGWNGDDTADLAYCGEPVPEPWDDYYRFGATGEWSWCLYTEGYLDDVSGDGLSEVLAQTREPTEGTYSTWPYRYWIFPGPPRDEMHDNPVAWGIDLLVEDEFNTQAPDLIAEDLDGDGVQDLILFTYAAFESSGRVYVYNGLDLRAKWAARHGP